MVELFMVEPLYRTVVQLAAVEEVDIMEVVVVGLMLLLKSVVGVAVAHILT
jgi:hypothetical protein